MKSKRHIEELTTPELIEDLLKDPNISPESRIRLEAVLHSSRVDQELIYRDNLTGLYKIGKNDLQDILEDEVTFSEETGYPFTVGMVDKTGLWWYNKHGHDIGDRAIIETANFLQKNLRPYDSVLGRRADAGDEFYLIIRGMDQKDAEAKRQQLIAESKKTIFYNQPLLMAVGLESFQLDTDIKGALQAVKHADKKLNEHKTEIYKKYPQFDKTKSY